MKIGDLNNQYIDDNSKVANQIAPYLVKERGGAELDVSDFLQIMAAELSNQSVMGGGDGGGSKTDYLSQLAQFTILEQMNTMTESIEQLAYVNQQNQAFNLVGSEVTYLDKDAKEQVGVVDKVNFTADGTILIIDGKKYPIGLVLGYSGKKTGSEDSLDGPVEEEEEIQTASIGQAGIDPVHQQEFLTRQLARIGETD